jgi:hypothetical protein
MQWKFANTDLWLLAYVSMAGFRQKNGLFLQLRREQVKNLRNWYEKHHGDDGNPNYWVYSGDFENQTLDGITVSGDVSSDSHHATFTIDLNGQYE